MAVEKHFRLLPQRVFACRQCRCAVWPDDIAGHLAGKAHDVKRAEINAIKDELSAYRGLATRESFEFPPPTDSIIAALAPPREGIACRFNDACRYVCGTEVSIRKHYATVHGWSSAARGGATSAEQRTAKTERERRMQRGVPYQQFFRAGRHSSYFQVAAAAPAARTGGDFDRLRELATQERDDVGATIQAGNRFEINAWIQRTGWTGYLEGKDRTALLELVAEPADDETLLAKVWEAVADVAKISQRTVANSTNAVKYAAIGVRNKDKNDGPLEAYFDRDVIAGRARTWQQIVACLMRNRSRNTVEYQATPDQARRLERLMHEAEMVDRRVAIERERRMDQMLEEIERGAVSRESEDESEESGDEHDPDHDGDHDPDQDQDQDQDQDPMTELQTACLNFCVELLNQETRNSEFESPLLAALAVLGVSADGWRDVSEYTPVLSETLKVARFMMVHKATNAVRNWDATRPGSRVIDLDGDTLDGNETDSVGGETVADQPIERGTAKERGVISEVTRIVDGFSKHGTSSPLENMIVLRAYGFSIHFNRTAEGNVNWKDRDTLLYEDKKFTISQFRGMMHGLVAEARTMLIDELLHGEPPAVPWASMCDNPVNRTPGWSFLKDRRTRWPVDGRMWMLDRLEDDTRMQRRFYTRGEVDRVKVRRYARTCDELLEKLLVLLHVTGGQPARGTELRSIRHQNTVAGDERNIFIDEGMLAYVTRYHKGWAMHGKPKVIHRYVPREVADVLIWYLWLVKPFRDAMQRFVGRTLPPGAFLWTTDGGEPWGNAHMARALSTAFEAGVGCKMGVLQYRHIAIAISRRHTDRAFDENDDEPDDAADLQAGHTSRIADMLYARSVMEMQGAVPTARQAYRRVSASWHVFLRFGRTAPTAAEKTSQRKRRWRLRDADVHQRTRDMLGSELRDGQVEPLKAVARGESPVVAVLPTGGGKSVLFMLPAWAEPDGLTVVVVPLVALREDMQRRCDELGVRCAAWDWRRPPEDATIVLVTPESAGTANFEAFVARAVVTKRLDRIVVDECHVMLDASFRLAMQKLDALTGIGAPLLLLTATLPPTLEGRLWEAMSWRAAPQLFRQPTVRANQRYSVISGPRETATQALVDGEPGKVVVYVNSRDSAESMAERLDARFFHAKMAPEVKSQLLADLQSGDVRVVVATSALGVGVDVADIRLVVHADVPRTLIDYAQESGRAGRDGQPSRAVIVGRAGRGCDDNVRRYMEATCRRSVLDAYLDGVERERCRDGEEPCDGCRPPDDSDDSGDDGVGVRQDRERQHLARQRTTAAIDWARAAQDARAAVRKWQAKCVPCHGRGRDHGHYEYRCSRADREALTKIRAWRGRVKMNHYGACYGCLLPQSLCGGWAERADGCFARTGQPCENKYVVSDVVFSLAAGSHPVRDKWARRLTEQGVRAEDEAAWLAWLSERKDHGSVEGSNVFWEFCWIAAMLDGYGGRPADGRRTDLDGPADGPADWRTDYGPTDYGPTDSDGSTDTPNALEDATEDSSKDSSENAFED